MAWTQNGPVSLPPQSAVYVAASLVVALAVVGAGMGLRASWRERPALDSGDQTGAMDDASQAKPLVEIPSAPQAAAANTATSSAADAADEADSNSIAAQTAAAQAVQSKPSRAPANIDDILTSNTEKPQAPAKPASDESAPPSVSDVPF